MICDQSSFYSGNSSWDGYACSDNDYLMVILIDTNPPQLRNEPISHNFFPRYPNNDC